MSEPTPEEVVERAKVIMSGIHEPCGMPHAFGEGCTEAWVLFSIRVAEQHARLAGWNECRKSLASALRNLAWSPDEIGKLIATLTPPAKEGPDERT